MTITAVQIKLLESLEEWYQYTLLKSNIINWDSEKEQELHDIMVKRYQDYRSVVYDDNACDLNFNDY